MSKQRILIYLLISYAHLSYQLVRQISYNGAVVKYSPVYFHSSVYTLRANSQQYVKYIEEAKQKKVDIIVFPEYGLTTIDLPERKDMQDWTTIIPKEYNPCTETSVNVSEALQRISCAAKNNTIYVVINIAEKEDCKQNKCPDDNVFYYNSNVVFDRTGKIIARYRKVHLYPFEKQLNVTETPEIVTFNTDFGVRFGTFTCMDILFYDPAIKLRREYRITEFVYPTAWFSETPFLTATQIQAGWSYTENANLLASGYNRPNASNIGSGIFLGRKKRDKAMLSLSMKDEIIIEAIEKKNTLYDFASLGFDSNSFTPSKDYYYFYLVTLISPGSLDEKIWLQNYIEEKNQNLTKKRMPEDIFLYRENIQNFETYILEGHVVKEICQNNFCCKFEVSLVRMDSRVQYRLVVFNGTRPFVNVISNIYVCSIIQCSSDSIMSCGSAEKSETVFSHIKISATFPDYADILAMPTSLTTNLLPHQGWIYEQIYSHNMNAVLTSKGIAHNFITFGIYAKNLNADKANK